MLLNKRKMGQKHSSSLAMVSHITIPIHDMKTMMSAKHICKKLVESRTNSFLDEDASQKLLKIRTVETK